MKKLKLVFAILGMIIMFNACAPEEVQPQTDQQKLEKFDVKSSDDTPPRKPGPM